LDGFKPTFRWPGPYAPTGLCGGVEALAEGTRSKVDEFAAIRQLARLGPDLDYPGGAIGDACYASEWLDCECHTNSPERDAAIALENRLRASDPLDIDPGLLQAISATWF
jgi:hypothetical protein